MSRFTRSAARLAAVAVLALGVVPAAAARASESPHPVEAVPKRYLLTATFRGGAGLTVVLTSATGRTLGTKALTTSPQTVEIRTPYITTLQGASFQLVNSRNVSTDTLRERSGDYFGPVVLAWGAATRTGSGTVFTKLRSSTSTTVNLAATASFTVARISGKAQGYAYAGNNGLKTTRVDTRTGQGTKALSGKPRGVGTYGRTNTGTGTTTPASVGLWGARLEVGEDPATQTADQTLGGDLDDDGIPNAYDVNDDGDARTDSSDASTPSPAVIVENPTTGVVCPTTSFRIFTNLKATQPNFAGTINAYGTGDFQATESRSSDVIEKTMSMVFSPITSVCGQSVTKTELRGVGVPYAPASFVELPNTPCGTGDYQWLIGQGRMCGPIGSPGSFAFGTAYDFGTGDLPSGQDVFAMRVTTTSGAVFEFTASPGFVFVTHPMLVAWAVTADGATPAPDDFAAVDYGAAISGPDGAAIINYPNIQISQTQDLHLKLYRPQRLAIEGEVSTSGFVDLGGFRYTPDIPNAASGAPGGMQGPGKCDALTSRDSTFTDTATVAPESAPILTLQWDLEACYASSTWYTGSSDFDLQVEPSGPGGNSAQKIRVTYT